nr:PepSY-associated TM helix domain-containing protein [Pararobbsia alpina]
MSDSFTARSASSQPVQWPLPKGVSTPAPRTPSRRVTMVQWLRRVHGWLGLWGAVLGLLFGTTGFLLNHRGGPLKISTGAPSVTSAELPLPSPAPASPTDLLRALQQNHALEGKPGRIQREPARTVAWGDGRLQQPEHWSATLVTPRSNTQVEYWVGNRFVSIKRTDNGLLATLLNFHRGTGLGIGWVLLVDTLAGSIILLSITGVLLWIGTHRRRALASLLVGGSIVAGMIALLS